MQGGKSKKEWDLDLSSYLGATVPMGSSAGTIFSVRFSPEGRHIAVIAGERSTDRVRSRKKHLLVVPTYPTSGSVRHYDLTQGADDINEFGRWSHFGWTRRGDSILAGGELVRLDEEKGCPATQHRAPDGRLMMTDNPYAHEDLLVRLMLRDASCDGEDRWEFSAEFTVKDLSLERGLVCVSRPLRFDREHAVEAESARVAGRSSEVLIVDPTTGKVMQRWPSAEIPAASTLRFADRGRVICGGAREIAPVRCWSVDTGKRVAEAAGVEGGSPIAVALSAPYAIASDYRSIPATLRENTMEVLRRRVVWDVRTGREVASWQPPLQSYDVGIDRIGREWAAFAMSPDGRYLAEGGDGSLRLFTIKP